MNEYDKLVIAFSAADLRFTHSLCARSGLGVIVEAFDTFDDAWKWLKQYKNPPKTGTSLLVQKVFNDNTYNKGWLRFDVSELRSVKIILGSKTLIQFKGHVETYEIEFDYKTLIKIWKEYLQQ